MYRRAISPSKILHSARFRRLSKEGFVVVFGQALAVAGALAGVRLLTQLLDPTAYGELVLGMTLATLVNQTFLGPLGNGVIRFFAPAVEKGDLGGYLKAVRRLVFLATGLLIILALLVVAVLLMAGLSGWIAIVAASFIFALFAGYNSILGGMQNAARRRSVVALHQGLEPWARFLIAGGLIISLGATSSVAMVGYAMALVVVSASQYFCFRSTIPEYVQGNHIENGWRGEVLAFSWPISIFGVFTWLHLVSDRWALNAFASTQEVGLYAVLFQLGYHPMSMAIGVAMQFFVPIFYQRAGDGTDEWRKTGVQRLSSRLVWMVLLLTGIISLVTFSIHSQIFAVLAAKEYGAVSYLLPWVLLAGGVFAAGQVIALNLMSHLKTRRMMLGKITTAIIGVIGNIAGAYWYGTAGIVAAGVIFSIVYFIWMALLLRTETVRGLDD